MRRRTQNTPPTRFTPRHSTTRAQTRAGRSSNSIQTIRASAMRPIARAEAISGFRLEPVAGLVEPRVFLESLAAGVFLCAQYIRHHSTPHYTPEPDVVHEIIGHAVTLASPRLAELNRLVGQIVKRTTSTEA